MDEVDGMSGGDRGGVGALNALNKKTRVSAAVHTSLIFSIILLQIPIICIANDRRSQKIKPLTNACYNMSFTKCAAFLTQTSEFDVKLP
jgi:replication factor C subunit 1